MRSLPPLPLLGWFLPSLVLGLCVTTAAPPCAPFSLSTSLWDHELPEGRNRSPLPSLVLERTAAPGLSKRRLNEGLNAVTPYCSNCELSLRVLQRLVSATADGRAEERGGGEVHTCGTFLCLVAPGLPGRRPSRLVCCSTARRVESCDAGSHAEFPGACRLSSSAPS